jgi:hypothetical protein
MFDSIKMDLDSQKLENERFHNFKSKSSALKEKMAEAINNTSPSSSKSSALKEKMTGAINNTSPSPSKISAMEQFNLNTIDSEEFLKLLNQNCNLIFNFDEIKPF